MTDRDKSRIFKIISENKNKIRFGCAINKQPYRFSSEEEYKLEFSNITVYSHVLAGGGSYNYEASYIQTLYGFMKMTECEKKEIHNEMYYSYHKNRQMNKES